MAAKAFAPAKVNLTLHVTGRRADGYHLLDSLVLFADVGDWVHAEPSDTLGLTVTGPMAGDVPADKTNLVWKAAELMGVGAAMTLEKHLPAGAGLGGGSSDAAAALFALAELTGKQVPREQAVSLGADVPVCLRASRSLMRGIGDVLEPAPHLPKLHAVLVNPGVALSTQEVFETFAGPQDSESPSSPRAFNTFEEVAEWVRPQRNDLFEPARAIVPVIDEVLQALDAEDGCAVARMSGSGPSCFGLFADKDSAARAAGRIATRYPAWWVAQTRLS